MIAASAALGSPISLQCTASNPLSVRKRTHIGDRFMSTTILTFGAEAIQPLRYEELRMRGRPAGPELRGMDMLSESRRRYGRWRVIRSTFLLSHGVRGCRVFLP